MGTPNGLKPTSWQSCPLTGTSQRRTALQAKVSPSERICFPTPCTLGPRLKSKGSAGELSAPSRSLGPRFEELAKGLKKFGLSGALLIGLRLAALVHLPSVRAAKSPIVEGLRGLQGVRSRCSFPNPMPANRYLNRHMGSFLN